MTPRRIVIVVLMGVFTAGVLFALLREVNREEAMLAASLSGVVDVAPELFASGQADIVKTDRLVLYLIDPATDKAVALRIVTPLVPPQVFDIGQGDSRAEKALSGAYHLVGITDKDGEIFKVTPGEVYGRSAEPIALGTEQVRLVLDQPFRGSLFNAAGPTGTGRVPSEPGRGPSLRPGEEARTIQGVVRVHPDLVYGVEPTDRLVILLFAAESSRPAVTKIIPHVFLPQPFFITVPEEAAGRAYYLRILTDKDGDPLNPVEGEVIGRGRVLIPPGTKGVDFVLDTRFKRAGGPDEEPAGDN